MAKNRLSDLIQSATADLRAAEAGTPCASCASYDADPARGDGLCRGCGHAVDVHGATITEASAVVEQCPDCS